MNTTINRNCLTYEQLQSYSLNRGEKEARAQLYQHISTCELCTCAVNGFAAIPFTLTDVDAICHQIDLKSKGMHQNPLTLPHVILAVASIASIFGFYYFVNSFSNDLPRSRKFENAKQISAVFTKKEHSFPIADISEQQENAAHNQKMVKEEKILEKIIVSLEPIKSITPDLTPIANKTKEVNVEPYFNTDVIYIYDLKVTNYNLFYFSNGPRHIDIVGHTPSYKENKESIINFNDKEFEQTIVADKVLKSALALFNNGKYNNALVDFELLLDHNPEDVNSLFYSAISYYQIGKYGHAIKNLEAILGNQNTVFHPEAKWNLAMSLLKIGEKGKAKQLLIEISNEQGFYSKRATEKLKGM
jgi:tetratricopeptide (TPR) repeat protein